MFYALNQKDFLVAGYTDPKYFKECKALFICGTPLATDKGFEDKLNVRLRQVEGRSSRKKAMTARRSCCSMPPTPTPAG